MEPEEEDIVEEKATDEPDDSGFNPLDGYTGPDIGTPLKSIRRKCVECSETNNEIKHCVITSCPLYPFRTGKNPYRAKREMTEEQLQSIRDRFAKSRNKNKA